MPDTKPKLQPKLPYDARDDAIFNEQQIHPTLLGLLIVKARMLEILASKYIPLDSIDED